MDRLVADTEPGMQPGTPPGASTLRTEVEDATAQENQELSVGHIWTASEDCMERCVHRTRLKQRVLPKTRHCNNYRVSEYGRDAAIAAFSKQAPARRCAVCFIVDTVRPREVPW